MTDKKSVLFPAYLPSLADFSVLTQYEVIWEISGNYQKQSLRNRTYITNDRGRHALTIPIKGKAAEAPRRGYDEILIDNTQPWQRTHWRTLQTAYRTSPYFEFYEHLFEPLFSQTKTHLLPFNLEVIETICKALQISFPTEKTADYFKELSQGHDHRYLISPKEIKGYHSPTYNQVFMDRHGFIPNLSVLDILFNEGPNALSLLKAATI